MTEGAGFGPWHPGLESEVPPQWRHLATVLRPENVFTSVAEAAELRASTGLPWSEIVAFRPERLMLHELLVRITADLEVPDGARIGDLGINFRAIARCVLERHLAPVAPRVAECYQDMRTRLEAEIERLLKPVGLRWGPDEVFALERSAPSADPDVSCAAKMLARAMSAVFTTQGHAWGTREGLARLTLNLAANESGGRAIGRLIEPLIRVAAQSEGYHVLPVQERPVVINTKGASASGKSTLRPMQKKLAGDIGLRWGDFALISPDIWRKQLLDYSSLGAAYKYAGAFTAEELQIVDQKLDRYMADKHRRGGMSHLLIDRFRFDSFAPDSAEAGSNLLTRFGQTLYLFFVITPPESLVERAWARGLEFGRYKAVDDTLAHAVEAYSGIPDVFFTWIRRADKRIQFEFLDNTVRLGERPRTVAFGDAATLNVMDVGCLLQVRRYARIEVNALTPEQVYSDAQRGVGASHADFLRRCLTVFPVINLTEQRTGRVYLRFESGRPSFADRRVLELTRRDPDAAVGLDAMLGGCSLETVPAGTHYLQDAATVPTLGQWGWAL